MGRLTRLVSPILLLAGAVACYRLPLRIAENDASGYEDVGVPFIEAVEYTPAGRDLRVALEAPGYVTVIIVDPDRGATVRFRRGELQSRFADKGVHRYPLDRLASPIAMGQYTGMSPSPPSGMGRATQLAPLRLSAFDPVPLPVDTDPDSTRREFRLASRTVMSGGGPVKSAHVVVLVSERPLDLVQVAVRLARGSLDPALVAQAAANVIEGGRWMAAMAPLRGQ
ncbi:MAG: hypothetical protein IT355_11530 [Gemmatimonadaceae bacterium]|nr:hypothetical protein [Gemmatimonadaceae bacterium]